MPGAVFEATSSLNISFYLAGSFLLAGPSLNVVTNIKTLYVYNIHLKVYTYSLQLEWQACWRIWCEEEPQTDLCAINSLSTQNT